MTPTTTQATSKPAAGRPSNLPAPSASHATCCWCHRDFATIGELLTHAEHHL